MSHPGVGQYPISLLPATESRASGISELSPTHSRVNMYLLLRALLSTSNQSPGVFGFCPSGSGIVSVASADSTIVLWDPSFELGDDESKDTGGVEYILPQLLFVHYYGYIKEVHWQNQAPGMAIGARDEGSDTLFSYIYILGRPYRRGVLE